MIYFVDLTRINQVCESHHFLSPARRSWGGGIGCQPNIFLSTFHFRSRNPIGGGGFFHIAHTHPLGAPSILTCLRELSSVACAPSPKSPSPGSTLKNQSYFLSADVNWCCVLEQTGRFKRCHYIL